MLRCHPCAALIAAHFGIENRGRRADKWLNDVCYWAWRVKVHLHLKYAELLLQVREAAEAEAIRFSAVISTSCCSQPGRSQSGARTRPRYSHRLQSGRGRRHRQTPRDHHDLSASTSQ